MSQKTIRLAQGESLLLYTDGVTEAFSPDGDLFGEARLLEAVRAVPSPSVEALLETVESRLNEFIDSEPLSDDLTMLAVRRK